MLEVSALLESTGVDAIELSGSLGLKISKYMHAREGRIDSKGDEIYYRDAAKLYKEKVSVPLILVGGIRSLEVARELVEKERVDYISLCRPLIREPNLIKRWQSGNIRRATCISCNKCYIPKAGKGIFCVLDR